MQTVTVTYTNGAAEPNVYKKVTSADELVVGKNYIIVNEANGVGMGALNTSRYGTGVTGLTIEDDKVDIGGTSVMELLLGGSSNNWTLRMGENGNYLSDADGSDNVFYSSASTATSTSDITKWTITPGTNTAIRSNYATTQYIRYNSSGLFGTYTVNAQSPVALYIQYEGVLAAPTFSPGSGTYSESQTVTISSETEGATIVYTVNNGEVQSGTSPVTVPVDETSTIEAYATMAGYDDSETVSASYTITGGSTSSSTIYRKVASDNDIVVGQKYILVYEGTPAFMGAITSSNIGTSVTGPTISNSQVDIAGYDITEWTLGGSSTAYTFTDGNGNYISWSSGNSLTTATSVNSNSSWTISPTTSGNGGYILTNVATNTRVLQYNTGNPRFACYTSSQGVACLYVQESTNPTLQIAPAEQTISDAAAAELSVTGANLTDGIAVAATPSTNWTVTPASLTTAGGTVSVSYTGRDLAASTTVEASSTGATSVSATVNYRADVWILTDGGVTDAWDYSTGTAMSYSDGIYTADFPVTTAGTFIVFARKLGESYPWNTRYLFGPESSGNWWLTDQTINRDCALDLNDDDPIYFQTTGLYTITINVANNTFKITKRNIDVTISPADGTTFTGETVSGTITSDPAGTIEWSTDGTTWQSYSDGFTATVNTVGGTVTVYARSTVNGVVSDVVSATYTRVAAPAPNAPNFSVGSGAVASGTEITITAPEGCTLYVDGQQVTSPYTVTVTQGTTITAYCVNSEGTPSETVTNTYTIAAVCDAMISFDDNGSDASADMTSTSILDYYTAGSGYVASTSMSKVYKGKTGIKFGSSSYAGEITFNLATDMDIEWKVSKIVLNAAQWSNSSGTTIEGAFTVTTSNDATGVTHELTSTDLLNYEYEFDGSEITSFTISTTSDNKRAYLKSITIWYDCAPTVEAPVINPATGTYYESQTVSITADDGCTIYYTTDGTEPTTSSTEYSGSFAANYTAGSTFTVKAIAVDGEGNVSDVTTAVYTWGTPSVTITPDSRNTTASSVTVVLTGTPANATIYYTTDGSTLSASNGTEYTGAFSVELNEIGDEVTVNAIAVVGSLTSDVASATYTRVENVIEVNAPFFSPLVNQTYYGDQTLQIGCTTPNADIYYEIVEVSGTTAPDASNVTDPTKASTYYDGTAYPMTVGNSYYVKAIAYIGNYASTISEGWYVIRPTSEWTNTTGADVVLENVAALRTYTASTSGETVTFRNPVQVVYMSKFTNDDSPLTYSNPIPEFVYVRDNTGYGVIYFGKGTKDWAHTTSGLTNSPATHFEMGDWIDGSMICGTAGTWTSGLIPQVGTNSKTITSWPATNLDNTIIIPEETTCNEISQGTVESNLCGHYLHLRYSTITGVDDYSGTDPRHSGSITDLSGTVTYYDRFWLYSGNNQSYTYSGDTYYLRGQNYEQSWFDNYQNQGATFDVFCVGDYYSGIDNPYEIYPIDFLWVYKPVISLKTDTYYEPQTATISVTQPEWAAEGVVIYYKTDDMEEWAVYTPGQVIAINGDNHIQAYAEVPAEKTDGTNYNDYVRSVTVSEAYTFEGIEDPTISQPTQVIEVVTGNESITTIVTDQNGPTSGAMTIIYVNGVPTDTIAANTSKSYTFTETTTITAVSYKETDGATLWSNTVSETYTFARSNGIEYNLLKTAPVVGNIYVIVNKAANMAMSNTQNATNRGSTGVLFKEGTNKDVVYGNDEIAQFVLEQVTGNRYYFKNVTGNGGYLCVETNEQANLVTTQAHDASGYDVATVTIGANNANADLSYPATITFTYEGTVRTMRYYVGGRVFSTYADASLNQPVFLYGAQVTPLHVIERDFNTSTTEQVTVSDRLIGVWAAKNILWAKDQNYASIDATSKRDDQLDYVREKANFKDASKAFQQDEWEQSNWVMLDFSNINADPFDYVGFEFNNNSVVGYYVDDLNYRIELMQAPAKVGDEPMTGYPGFLPDPVDEADRYIVNHYVPSNFYEPNLNWGENTGYWYEGTYNGNSLDTCIFFMNPKIQEIAQVWAVWNATERQFTIYKREGFSVNGYDLDGAFAMTDDLWQYNHRETASGLTDEQAYGSVEQYLIDDAYYMFHVAVMRDNYNYGHRKASTLTSGKRNAVAKDSQAISQSIRVYPLDLTSEGAQDPPTSVRELLDLSDKTVDSVRYYNIVGQGSDRPFEGTNIVVTRYNDGTVSTAKVLR